MKLKYYMRGLGIGIIVTSLLMGYSNKTHATDQKSQLVTETNVEETDNSSLTLREQNDALSQVDVSEEETGSAEQNDNIGEITSESETFSKESVSENPSEEEVVTDIDGQEGTSTLLKNGDKVIITVNTGEGSGTVARKLENAGVIDNASEFDAYLMQHGYDKSISRGDHEVVVGSSWMEIAKQLTLSK